MDVAIEAPNSFYPSLLRQTAQTIDPYYREVRDNNVVKQALNRTISNTPGLSQTLPKKYEVTGKPIMREGGIAQNFLNPANTSTVKNDEVLNKSFDLYKNEDNARALMPVATKSIKINGEQLKLDNKQISKYQEDMGKIGYHLREKALNNPDFKAMDDSEKVKYLDKLNQSVNQAVKIKLFKANPKKYESFTQDILDNYDTFTKGQ